MLLSNLESIYAQWPSGQDILQWIFYIYHISMISIRQIGSGYPVSTVAHVSISLIYKNGQNNQKRLQSVKKFSKIYTSYQFRGQMFLVTICHKKKMTELEDKI